MSSIEFMKSSLSLNDFEVLSASTFDDEKSIQPKSCIASISLGAARKFDFKHRQTQEKVSILLEPGSLLAMMGSTQEHWIHQLPKSKKIKEPRLNLTFRQMI